MFSFQKNKLAMGLFGFVAKKLPWKKVSSVAQIILSNVDRTESDALASEASTGQKVTGALKKLASKENLEMLLPALELMVGDRFNDAKVRSAVEHFQESYIALQNALRDSKDAINPRQDEGDGAGTGEDPLAL